MPNVQNSVISPWACLRGNRVHRVANMTIDGHGSKALAQLAVTKMVGETICSMDKTKLDFKHNARVRKLYFATDKTKWSIQLSK